MTGHPNWKPRFFLVFRQNNVERRSASLLFHLKFPTSNFFDSNDAERRSTFRHYRPGAGGALTDQLQVKN
jgi:hypothetical protein